MPEFPVTYRGVVYPSQCDQIGHMNVASYVAKFDEGTWNLFAMVGLTPSFMREQRRGMAAVQQKLVYKRELRPGDIVAVRSGVLEIRDRVIRYFHEMFNAETGELAAVTVLTAVCLDTQVRKACPFPEEIVARAREMITGYDPGI